MFSRSVFRRALALPFEPSSSRPSTTIFRACLTTQPEPPNPNPETPLRAEPRAQFNDPTEQQHHPPTAAPSSSSSSTTSPASLAPFTTPQNSSHIPATKLPLPPTFTSPLQVTQSLVDTLPYMTAQPSHYVTAHLHAKPYLLTAGDHLRLPFHMPKVQPGDVIRLNRASVLGSRDFTLKGTPYVDERLFECRARVMGVDAEPMRIKEKTKRRQRHVKTARSKHRYTLLRIMDVKVKTVEELLGEGAVVVEGGQQQQQQQQPKLEVKS